MGFNGITAVAVILATGSLFGMIYLMVVDRRSRLQRRMNELSGKDGGLGNDSMRNFARSALPKMGATLLPTEEDKRTRLQSQLVQAGFYSRQAMLVFLGVKLMLMVGPAIVGLALGILGVVDLAVGVIFGALLGVFGMVGPTFFLDNRKSARQTLLRRALPDALDVLVICLEGGLSLSGALRQVAGELRTAHPTLARELNIVQREVQLGRTTGEALRQFSDRTDLEEVRSLASVIIQTEKFGASMVKALRVHAESLRSKRMLYAEEMAQKAATKVLFPTVFFILPATFVVILGPAAIQIMDVFSRMKFGQ